MSESNRPDNSVVITHEQLSKLRHDLRTPINQIIGYSEMLQEIAEEENYQEATGDLERITQAARALLDHLEHGMTEMLAVSDTAPVDREVKPAGESTGHAAEKPSDETARLPQAHTKAKSTTADTTILVVDDNEMNRDMLSRRLKRVGYQVDVAEDGLVALDLISQKPYDLVLLDIMMPKISGIEVLERLRRQYDMTDLPIIMATARDASEEIVNALELGANDYVTKPIDFPVVLARSAAHLRLKAAAEEIRSLAQQLEQRNQFIRSIFGRYLTDEIVDSVLDNPEGLELGGSSRNVTILMSDLRGFSALSEQLSPEDVVRLLNLYLGRMTDIIQKHGGTIDEFIGDAILVIFGAPKEMENHAECAVACALEMQLAMSEVNAVNQDQGLPVIEMGIGINTGPVVVGNIGSDKRTKYGVVGRHVNMASRIESYTVGGQILISDNTANAVGSSLMLAGNTLVSPKGCKESLLIHNVCGIQGDRGLQLPTEEADLYSLSTALDFRFAVLDGKNVPQMDKAGSLLKISEREAEIELSEMVPLLANITLELEAEAADGKVYGKITHAADGSSRFTLRFSSIDPGVREVLFKDL